MQVDAPRLHTGPIADAGRGYTPRELARRWRCRPDTVRAWIASGELRALNLARARCGKPRYVVTAEAVAAFERAHLAMQPKPAPAPRKRRQPELIDFYPDP